MCVCVVCVCVCVYIYMGESISIYLIFTGKFSPCTYLRISPIHFYRLYILPLPASAQWKPRRAIGENSLSPSLSFWRPKSIENTFPRELFLSLPPRARANNRGMKSTGRVRIRTVRSIFVLHFANARFIRNLYTYLHVGPDSSRSYIYKFLNFITT